MVCAALYFLYIHHVLNSNKTFHTQHVLQHQCTSTSLVGSCARREVTLVLRTDEHSACHRMSSLTVKEKRKAKGFGLQERGTALKNKGDRWQYIKFYANEKKERKENQLIKIDYSCFVNVFLN